MNNIAGGFMNTDLGNVQIDKEVIAKYATLSELEEREYTKILSRFRIK